MLSLVIKRYYQARRPRPRGSAHRWPPRPLGQRDPGGAEGPPHTPAQRAPQAGLPPGQLENPTDDDRVTLAAQRVPLERWIDDAAWQSILFSVFGEFTQRIDDHGKDDHFGGELDDADPPGVDLSRLSFNLKPDCWRGARRGRPAGLSGIRYARR